MKSPALRILAAMLFLIGTLETGAAQDEQPEARFENWDVHVIDGPDGRTCVVASRPIDSQPRTRVQNGETVEVRRGEILILITDWPADGTQNEIQVQMGYAPTTDVTVIVDGGPEFTLDNVQGESAWFSQGVQFQDDLLTNEMKRGRVMEVRARSAFGTNTVDTYSLIGITAALARSAQECS